jgi:hypothetical protein
MEEVIMKFARNRGVVGITERAMDLIVDGVHDDIRFFNKIKNKLFKYHSVIYHVFNVVDAVEFELEDNERYHFLINATKVRIGKSLNYEPGIDEIENVLPRMDDYMDEFEGDISRLTPSKMIERVMNEPTGIYYMKRDDNLQFKNFSFGVEKAAAYSYIAENLNPDTVELVYKYYIPLHQDYESSIVSQIMS